MLIQTIMAAATLYSAGPSVRDPFDQAMTFAGCAGFFEAAADQYAARGQAMQAEEYRGAARGAEVVSGFFASGFIEDQEQRNRFVADGKENAFVRHSAAFERDEILETEAQRCFDIQALQIEILDQLRRIAAGAPPER